MLIKCLASVLSGFFHCLAWVSGLELLSPHSYASHLTPEEAVKVAMDTKSNLAVAMHWGTIELSDEPPWEPPVRFKKAAQNNGIASDQTWVMKVGETRLIPSKKD